MNHPDWLIGSNFRFVTICIQILTKTRGYPREKTKAQTYLGVIARVDSVINWYDVLFQKMKPMSFIVNLKTTNHENDHFWSICREKASEEFLLWVSIESYLD